MSQDQRAFARYSFMGVIKCFANIKVNGCALEHTPVLNLSAGGMFVWIDHPKVDIKKGAVLKEIKIEIDNLSGLTLQGEVVRLMPVRTSLGCGIQFTQLDEDEFKLIEHYVQHRLHD